MQNQMHARDKAVSRTWPALMRLHAVVSDAWYCDSSTTYTTLKTERLPTSSGTTLRSAGLLLVKRPLWPVATMLGADERSTARLQAEQSSAEHASVDGRAGARTRHCVGSAGAVLRQRRRRMHPAHRDCCCCCCARLVASSCCANWAISLCDLTAAVGARNDDARQMSILSAATTPSAQPRLPDCAESAVWRRGVHGRTDTRRSGWGKASIARRRGGDASDGEDPH